MIHRLPLLLLASLAFVLASLPAALSAQKTKITISGSDTMNILSQRLAEEYSKANPNVEISVRGGGSGVGVRDLVDGLNDICQSSRKIKDAEIKMAEENGYTPVEHIIALDGLAVAVHASSPVKELSLGQIRAIFTGAVKKWNELDPSWPNAPIALYSRESNCGTYDFFKEHVLKGADFAPNTSYLAATAAVANSVARDKNGIGFGGVAYFAKVTDARCLAVRAEKDSVAVAPVMKDGHVDLEAIQTGRYPISRPLHFYTPDAAAGEVASFINWVLGEQGQRIVEAVEYIPLSIPAKG